jgi:hypothetical protein
MRVERENYSLSTFIEGINVAGASIDGETVIFEQCAHRYQLKVASGHINHQR